MLAVPNEPEAIDPAEIPYLSKSVEARARFDEEHRLENAKREQRSRSARLRDAMNEATRLQTDGYRELHAIDAQIALLEAKNARHRQDAA